MRMLIVDDDRMICAGTARRIVNMQFAEIESVECAYSGEEALRLMREKPFDAMFTDIRMDEMDGLKLIQSAKDLNPNLICVVITAFDRFQYAQQAIRLGVEDFLLKPLSEQTMRRRIGDIVDKYTKMSNQKESQLELEICAQMLTGERDIDACFQLCGLRKPEGNLCMAVWKDPGFSLDARDIPGWTWRPQSHRFMLMEPSVAEWLRMRPQKLRAFVGISTPGLDLKRLSEQASMALEFAWLKRTPEPLFYSAQNLSGLSVHRRRLLAETRALNDDGVRSFFADFLGELPESRRQAAGILIREASGELLELRASLGMEPGTPLELMPGEGADSAVQRFCAEIRLTKAASSNPDRLHPVAYAKRYAQEHLYEPIDMAVVANHLNLSYAYFSRIFREHAGMTFTKYLLEIRMQEVCRLLLNGEKLVDIAEKLSYQNAANLTRSFTREFGVSPSKWLEQRAAQISDPQ